MGKKKNAGRIPRPRKNVITATSYAIVANGAHKDWTRADFPITGNGTDRSFRVHWVKYQVCSDSNAAMVQGHLFGPTSTTDACASTGLTTISPGNTKTLRVKARPALVFTGNTATSAILGQLWNVKPTSSDSKSRDVIVRVTLGFSFGPQEFV
jgi:hypothetical protein